MAFVIVVMPAAAALGFFVILVVGMLFGLMGSFLRLMAVTASAVMYMLFIVLFHGMSPYLEWKLCFLSGIILWCYFSILQMHRKWSMRNTLIFQVGQGETIGLDRAKKGEGLARRACCPLIICKRGSVGFIASIDSTGVVRRRVPSI